MQQQLIYSCVPQIVQDADGGGCRAYQLRVTDPETGIVLRAVNDVCRSAAQARELEELLRGNDVALVHVMDILEDWLAE